MSDDQSIDIAKELVRQLPVKQIYDDGLQQPIKQVGSVATDLIKTIHLVLAPIQVTAALQDRFRSFLDRAVRRVATVDQVAPPPQILGPVLEGIKYEPEGTPIDEMFSELLSRGMNKGRVQEAHPAFPAIIKQLSVDEAVIIALLAKRPTITTRMLLSNNVRQTPELLLGKHSEDIALEHPSNIYFYFDHLSSLGLTTRVEQESLTIGARRPSGLAQFGRGMQMYKLTDFGKLFAKACTASSPEPPQTSEVPQS